MQVEHLVALVGHLAWPTVVLIGLWLVRREVRMIAERLAIRIGSDETDVTLGRAGLQIRQRTASADQRRDQLLQALRDDPDFEQKLVPWIQEKGISVSVTSFLYGSLYESLRRAAADELLPAADPAGDGS